MSGSGPACNLRLITAGEAKSRNGTQLLPAAPNYFSTTGFPSLLFNVSFLASAASLFVFDLSLSCLILSLPTSHNLNILLPPPAHLLLHLFFWCLFLALLFSLALSICSVSTLLRGPRTMHWVWSWRLVLLSLLRVLVRPIYQ